MLSGEENLPVRLLQSGANRVPLSGPVESVRSARIDVSLPGVRLDGARKLRRVRVEGNQIARDYLGATSVVLRSQNIGFLADGVAAKNPLRARLIFRAVKIVVRGDIADERKILFAPEAP